MPQFQSQVQTASLNGANRLQPRGVAHSPVTIGFADTLPTGAAHAGDINGGGFDDLVVGAMSDGVASQQGAAYVIYGHPGGAPLNLSVSTLDGSNGFKVAGNF